MAVAGGCGSSGDSIFSDNGSEDDQVAALLLTTTAAGSLATTGVLLTVDQTNQDRWSMWLQNRREIAVSIARGHGSWVDDLADELQLPEGLVPQLGEVLKRNHERLTDTLREPVKTEDWKRLVGNVLCCDPWLYPFARPRFDCQSSAEPAFECIP